MKKIFFTILLIVVFLHSYSQHWQWAVKDGSQSSDDAAISVCQDSEGNIYVTGIVLYPTAYFQTDTFQVNGFNDIFLAKYDANGNEIWVKVFGGPFTPSESDVKFEYPSEITFNSTTNSVYLTGYFIGSCSIDTFVLEANGYDDRQIFLAKFDLNGNCIWAKGAGSSGDDYGLAVTTLPLGSIFITGTTANIATFDSITIPKGSFLAKYDDDGNCLWAKNIFINASDSDGTGGLPNNLKIFNNNLIIAGQKSGDSTYIDTVLITGVSPNILAKLDTSGNLKWATRIGLNSLFGDLTVDRNGNSYFSALFFYYSIFEGDTIYGNSSSNFYFVKYDKNGNLKWVKKIYSTGDARLRGCSVDSNGTIYLSGYFSDSLFIGTYNIKATDTISDFFVAAFDSNGTCIGVAHSGQAEAYDVSATSDGQCYVVGNFRNTLNFGDNVTLQTNDEDIFIAKIDKVEGVIKNPLVKMPDNGQIIIYPNPANSTVTIRCSKDLTGSSLEILDINGRTVKQTTIHKTLSTINISHLTKGVYFVKISSKQGVEVKKIVVN